ncbi:hypothetical protein [Mycolicibacterium llatzerense]|uniref:hypothetical protein n=1 Tax=Mycolicibacterium llatzerense TaxID=280871 RepID=UPI0021B60483|nr:hypothetical protein [Mycolicibacterium llatzerense]MCT7372708.1 hypothetical protein [Mycolicibacterium llatzerense]
MVNTARTVVYRHPCDCDTASRPLVPGEKAEHRFEVDGEPFPWHIATDGAKFRKHTSGLYQVSCTVIPLDRNNNELLRVIVDTDQPVTFEYIDGTRREFPWHVTGPVFISAGDRDVPLIALTFIAEDVDTDTEIEVDEDTNETTSDIAAPLGSTAVLMPRQHGRPETAVTKAIGKYASLTAPPGYQPVDYTGRGA